MVGAVEMVGQLVRVKRVAKGLTQSELALKTGLRQTYISQVENGEIAMPRDHNLDALGAALDLSRTDFYRAGGMLEGIEPLPQEGASLAGTAAGYAGASAEFAEIGRQVVSLVNERSNIRRGPQIRAVPDVFRVPVVNGMSATELASEISQVEQWIEVPASLLNGAQRPAAYIIVGDCLWERWGIKTGDTLIIDLANTDPRDGQIVAARINDADETAKEFYRVAAGVDLRPTTPGYNTIEVRAPDQLLIIGVYVTHLVTGKR